MKKLTIAFSKFANVKRTYVMFKDIKSSPESQTVEDLRQGTKTKSTKAFT